MKKPNPADGGTDVAAWYIRTRAEFFEVLSRTLAGARARGEVSPFWAWHSFTAQLEAIQEWTKDGRTPSEDERARVTMGRIAVREFDGEPPEGDAEFLQCIVQLAGYFDSWPEDPK